VFSVCLSLYILDNIGRRHLTFNESRHLFYTGLAWMLGPMVGIWLWTRTGRVAPFALSAIFSRITLGFFWMKRLGPTPTFKPRLATPPPLRNIPRFFRQRYMHIAYAVTLTRGLFWASLFIYGPLYVLESGLPAWVAGALLSTVAALLVASPLVYRLASRLGARAVIVIGFCCMGSALISLAALGEAKPIGVVIWIVAAAGTSIIDVVGNVPFMRTVRPREHIEMTTVFSTWREVSSLLAPILAVAVLALFPFSVFYLLIGILSFAAAVTSSFLPRRI
jgi:ACDE family multidrug resistance protein